MARAQRRPFRLRLLHPVLAEIALPGGDQRLDRLGRLGLGDGDQGDFVRPRARRARAARAMPVADLVQPLLMRRSSRLL